MIQFQSNVSPTVTSLAAAYRDGKGDVLNWDGKGDVLNWGRQGGRDGKGDVLNWTSSAPCGGEAGRELVAQ